MNIKMDRTLRGVEDGFTIRRYFEGKIYDVGAGLAHRFIWNGVAHKATPEEMDEHLKAGATA